MRPRFLQTIGALLLISLSLGVATVCAADTTQSAATSQSASQRIATAANAFLATLDEPQRKKVLFAFDDAQQRTRWSNLPTGVVPRGGISLAEMNPAQRAAALALVSSALSRSGFEKVQQIMEGDEVNKAEEQKNPGRGPRNARGQPPAGGADGPSSTGSTGSTGGTSGPPGAGGAGGNGGANGGAGSGGLGGPSSALFGRDLYYLSILGTPSDKSPWMLQFGGHHLALNITIAGDRGVLTPTLTGAQPALYTVDGKIIRPLKGESDKGLALLNALDEKQRSQAIFSYRVADLVLGPGQDGKTILPEGLKASSMTPSQRALLLDVISEWSGIIHDSAATARMAEVKASLDDTWFAWSGPTTAKSGNNITAYYRIQGPTLVIEYAPQTLGGDPSMHIHTMYRDPTNDYGRKFTAQ